MPLSDAILPADRRSERIGSVGAALKTCDSQRDALFHALTSGKILLSFAIEARCSLVGLARLQGTAGMGITHSGEALAGKRMFWHILGFGQEALHNQK